MKKKKNVSTGNRIMHKIRLGAVRAEQVHQGVFDGRFRTRSEKSSKVYNRKKMKNKLLAGKY
jgi:hypothetical protein